MSTIAAFGLVLAGIFGVVVLGFIAMLVFGYRQHIRAGRKTYQGHVPPRPLPRPAPRAPPPEAGE